MAALVGLTQTQIFTGLVSVLGTFGLVNAAGAAVPVIRGQVNRVPEPNGTDFVVLWPISRDRLTMNVDGWADVIAAASITANSMTVSSVSNGAILPGMTVYGTGVTSGTTVVSQTSGTTGGAGVYVVTTTPNLGASTLYIGTYTAMQETEVTIQADVHGPASADNAARIATLFRDWYGVSAFIDTGYPMGPLHTTDPRQMPFENGEQQTEERWVVDLCIQANVVVTVPAQFADKLSAQVIPADVIYPP